MSLVPADGEVAVRVKPDTVTLSDRRGLVANDDLEDSQMLQDAVLSVHHSLMHMFDALPMAKIIENHLGDSFVRFQNQ